MNRIFLFRGKRTDNGEWIRGDLITTPFIRNITQQNIIYILDITKADYDCFEDLVEDNGIFEVDPETVCQYTGLTDKSGRKIFEGDIVKHFYDSKILSKVNVGIISWNESKCGFHRSSREDNCFYKITDYCKYEVIGNIFDNPELLEVGNETD